MTPEEKRAVVQATYDTCLWFAPYSKEIAIFFEARYHSHFERVHHRLQERMKTCYDKGKPWFSAMTVKALRHKSIAKFPFLIYEFDCWRTFTIQDDLQLVLTYVKTGAFDINAVDMGGRYARIDGEKVKPLDPQAFELMKATQTVNALTDVLAGNDTGQQVAKKKLKI